MARFVSPHRNYARGVRGGVESHLGPDGRMVPEVKELVAQFTPDLVTPEARNLALSTFTFRGLPIFENGQTVDPTYRISVFDSEVAKLQNGWTDEDEALVVEALRDSVGPMHVEEIPDPVEKPWNGYDELTDADRIVELALAINADLMQVEAYERENKDRADVIEAIQAAREDETIIVSA